MNTKYASRALSLLLALTLCAQLGGAAAAAGEGDTIYIGDANDLRAFAERCAYDAWSEGKTVILQRDVALGGVDFLPIASFGGTFEGNGHTISGLNVSSGVSPAGLFGTIAPSGVVQNLNVEGSVAPSGGADVVGGIAGRNRGTLVDCTFTGTVNGEKRTGGVVGENALSGTVRRCDCNGGVFGKNMTGGVAGMNHGALSFCVNRAYVNTNTIDPSLSFEKLDLSLSGGLSSLVSPDVYNVTVDSGGVAGFSDGALFGCRNYGSVGYQHIGYNVGGVVGRSSGHVASCGNEGSVYGRREVGGVAGVAEPYVKLDLKESSVEQVRRELDALASLIDRTVNDAEAGTGAISTRLSDVNRSVEDAADSARALSTQLGDYWDGTVEEVNRGSEILSVVIPQLYDITQDLSDVTELATKGLESLEQALGETDLPDSVNGDAFAALSQMAQELRTGTLILDAGTRQLQNGMKTLEGTVAPKEGLTEDQWRDIIYGPADANGKRSGGALGKTAQGLRDAANGTGTLASVLGELAAAAANGSITDITDLQAFLDAHDAVGALAQIGDGLRSANEGLDVIAANTETHPENLSDGLAGVREGLRIMTEGRAGDNGGAFTYFASAFDSLSRACDAAAKAMNDLQAELDNAEAPLSALRESAMWFRDASNGMTTALGDTARLLDYLRNQEALHFNSLGEETEGAANTLYNSVRGISNAVDLLNREAKTASDQVLEDVRAINRQFTTLMDTLLDVVEDAEGASVTTVVEDTSDDDVDAVVNGKVLLCSNTGEISGDIDVGGVVGAMMIYNELDPENDENLTSSAFHKRYELKCVVQDCTNSGTVTGKRDNVGAVCGSATMGVISGCEAYGSARSEGGDYVGGVAGYADNIVRKCWSKCTLAGLKYIGGVVGAGKEEGSNLRVEGCCAMVEVEDGGEQIGSIAGEDRGHLTGNLFVSDTLPGINRISERGRAEPMAFEDLLGEEGLPAEFRHFELKFVANGETISSQRFSYGDSFGDDVFPEIPAVAGKYGRWDRTELQNLCFDTTVTAVYETCVSALASDIARSASRPTFFVEGAFADDEALTAEPAIFDFDDGQDDLLHRLRSYRRTLLEQWLLEFPDDGAPYNTVRYLPPEGTWGHLELYANEGGRWQRLNTGEMGSYLTFAATARTVELTVVSTATPWWVWALVGGFVLVAAVLLALLLAIRHKRVHPAAPQELSDEEKKKLAALRKKRRNIRVALIAAALALGCAVGAVLLFAPGLTDSMGLYMLLHNYAERDDLDMELSVSTELGGRKFDADINVFTTSCSGKRVSCVMWEDIPLYYCDGILLLENGRAYRAGDVLPDYTKLLSHAAGLFRAVDVTVSEENGVKTYHAAAQGDAAKQILSALLPDAVPLFAETETVTLDLVLTDGEPTSLRVSWAGENGSASAELRPVGGEHEHSLPQQVQAVVSSGEYVNADAVGEEFKRLILAWTELVTRDPLDADVTLTANCGPLLLDETLDWQRARWNGTQLSCVSRRGTRLYYTDDAACTGSGAPLVAGGDGLTNAPKLLHLAYEAFLLGEATCTETVYGWRYDVELDENAMADFAAAIAPETRSMGLAPDEGSIRLELSGNSVSSVAVQCRGNVRVVRTDVPASVGASMTFREDGAFYTPSEKVLSVLGLTETE
ncbi:MAG: hypothetical protein E7474_14365 [Ruminococcaceae bacterium]|nr:hypothetical protein [Oscillospiraceae bacterium]